VGSPLAVRDAIRPSVSFLAVFRSGPPREQIFPPSSLTAGRQSHLFHLTLLSSSSCNHLWPLAALQGTIALSVAQFEVLRPRYFVRVLFLFQTPQLEYHSMLHSPTSSRQAASPCCRSTSPSPLPAPPFFLSRSEPSKGLFWSVLSPSLSCCDVPLR